jgi:hypothetical protein
VFNGTPQLIALMPKPCRSPFGVAYGPVIFAAFITTQTTYQPLSGSNPKAGPSRLRPGAFVRGERHKQDSACREASLEPEYGDRDLSLRFFALAITIVPSFRSIRSAVNPSASEIRHPVWASVAQNVRTSCNSASSAAFRNASRSAGVKYLRCPCWS